MGPSKREGKYGNIQLNAKISDSYIKENSTLHHTHRFHFWDFLEKDPSLIEKPCPQDNVCDQVGTRLVVRRGQEFKIKLSFDKEVDLTKEKLFIVFKTGDPKKEETKRSNHTEIHSLVYTSPVPEDQQELVDWTVWSTFSKGCELELFIKPGPYLPVGAWRMSLIVETFEDEETKYTPEKLGPKGFELYVLFNAWCKGDQVFLENEDQRQEYIMNDVGKFWIGTAQENFPYVWNFGQFENSVLKTCMLLLKKILLPNYMRGDAVMISRMAATMVSASLKGNVIEVKYGNDFIGGTCPRIWQGSVKILEEYLRYEKPVQYGQCWVIACVTNTVFRCLGIPSRVVTNFNSCRDSDNNMMYELFVDEKAVLHGREDDNDGEWSYHVWNEVWMVRDDLRDGHNGWQAIDPSPQQVTERSHVFGPSSVKAIANGNIGIKFDVGLLFAEVNADVVYWLYKFHEPRSVVINIDKERIGKSIITKKPGIVNDTSDFDKENITANYKPKEGSEEGRRSLLGALAKRRSELYGSAAKVVSYGLAMLGFHKGSSENASKPPPFSIELVVPKDVQIGSSFTISIKLKNTSPEERCELAVVLEALSYTGIYYYTLKAIDMPLHVTDKKEEVITMEMSPEEYVEKLADLPLFNVRAVVKPHESTDWSVAEKKFCLRLPSIKIEPDGPFKENEENFLTFTFINPLPIALTNCKFNMEGPGFYVGGDIPIRSVPEGEKVEGCCTATPREIGKKILMINFWSNELKSVQSVLPVNVLPN